MVNFMMAVNRYCADCMKDGEFLPLRFVMMNIHSGMWMCPKTECIFPMNSHLMKEYIEEDMTTEKVLQLTKMGRRRVRMDEKNLGDITKADSVHSMRKSSSSRSVTSDQSSHLTNTTNETDSIIDDRSSSISSSTSSKLKKTVYYYPLWENTSLLCWLDAALAMLVLNSTMSDLLSEDDCFIGHLFTEYKKILVSYNTNFNYDSVQKQLDALRNNILKFLQPKLLANYGDEDSPLVCLPLVLRTSKKLSEALEISYRCIFKCESCGFERTDGFKKIVMSLPNTNVDLDFNNNIYFSRGCYKCFTDHQKTKYEIEKYPLVMFAHFPQGVRSRSCWLDFNFTSPDGEQYIVTQIIQYLNKRRHFISWSYSFEEKLWLEADDLKDPVAHYKFKKPRCRPQEVHLVIWERLSLLETASLLSKETRDIENVSSANSVTAQKGSSPEEISLESSCVTTPIGDVPLNSCESSRRSSLCSGDNIPPDLRSAKSYTTANPFRSVKNAIQNGLRNTPRYEPYIPRKIKQEQKTEIVIGLTTSTPIGITGDTFVKREEHHDVSCHTKIKSERTCKYSDACEADKYKKEDSQEDASLDFLKGILSEEELGNFSSSQLLARTTDRDQKGTSSGSWTVSNKINTSPETPLDELSQENMSDIYDMFVLNG